MPGAMKWSGVFSRPLNCAETVNTAKFSFNNVVNPATDSVTKDSPSGRIWREHEMVARKS